LNQCTLSGFKDAATDKGWDLGVFVHSRPTSSTTPAAYNAEVNVQINGGTVKNCEVDGIYIYAETDSKAFVETLETTIHSTGIAPLGSIGGNGVHVYSYEGYAGYKDSGSMVRGNGADGVLAHTYGTRLAMGKVPMGTWLGLEDTELKNNLGNGVQLAGPKTHFIENQGGVVGGTWHASGSDYSLLKDPTVNPGVNFGPGYINRALIHDNTKDGINILLNTPDGATSEGIAHCIIANSFIWKNLQNGVHLESAAQNGSQTRFLIPIMHCTVAENSGYSFHTSGLANPNYDVFYRQDPAEANPPIFPMLSPKMRIHNSIFQAATWQDPDSDVPTLGLMADAFAAFNPRKIGVGSSRGRDLNGAPFPGTKSTAEQPPFLGSSVYPDFYYLASGFQQYFSDATTISKDSDVGEVLTEYDYVDPINKRPTFDSGDRDKGAHEGYRQ
jgi:hypothetical protein